MIEKSKRNKTQAQGILQGSCLDFFFFMPLKIMCINRVNVDFPLYGNVEDARERVYPII